MRGLQEFPPSGRSCTLELYWRLLGIGVLSLVPSVDVDQIEHIPGESLVSLGSCSCSQLQNKRRSASFLSTSCLVALALLRESDTSALQLKFEFDTKTQTRIAIESGRYEQL